MRTVAGADRDHRNRLQCLTQTHLVGQDPTTRTRQSRQPGNSLHLIRAQSRLNLCSAKAVHGCTRIREQPHRGLGASDLRVVVLDRGMRCGRNVMCAGVDDALPRGAGDDPRSPRPASRLWNASIAVVRSSSCAPTSVAVIDSSTGIASLHTPGDPVGIPSADSRAAGSASPQNAKDMCSGMYVACRRVEHG